MIFGEYTQCNNYDLMCEPHNSHVEIFPLNIPTPFNANQREEFVQPSILPSPPPKKKQTLALRQYTQYEG